MDKIYYVYCFYDENKIPFYIGFGKKDRITQHLYKRKSKDKDHLFFYNKLNKIINDNKEFTFRKLRENLTKKEAIIIEQILITLIGRRDLNEGTLTNLTNGGEGAYGSITTGSHIAIYDVESLKLIKTFTSIIKCAKFIGVKESTVRIAESRYDRTGNPVKYYVLRFDDIPKESFTFKKPERKFDNFKKSIRVINKLTNEEISFNKVKDCAEYFNINRRTVLDRIKNSRKGVDWIFEYDSK